MKDTAIELPRSIKKLGNITDPSGSRYALGYVQVERWHDNTIFIATDGAVMSAVYDTSDDTAKRCDATPIARKLLSREDIKKKIPTNKFTKNYIDSDTFEISTIPPSGQATFKMAKEGEGRFPKWKEVFKSQADIRIAEDKDKEAKWKTCTLNVARLKKIIDIYQAENIESVEVRILDGETQAEFIGKKDDSTCRVESVLMPMASL